MNNKEVVTQVVNAFLKNDFEKAFTYMSDDIKMGWPGFFDLEPGLEAVRKFFKDVPQIISGSIDNLIEEGNTVIGSGVLISKGEDGNSKTSYFCDIYVLSDRKVKEIKSYMVFEQPKQTN